MTHGLPQNHRHGPQGSRKDLFFHLFLTCRGKKVVAADRSLRERLCNTVFSGSVYFMLETGRTENMREKKNGKESMRNYVGGTVLLNCSFYLEVRKEEMKTVFEPHVSVCTNVCISE